MNKKSAGDHCSLYQLRNLIGRTNVCKKPLDDFNACDDFFNLVITAHTLSAASTLLKMEDLGSIPVHAKITDGELRSTKERQSILMAVSEAIVDTFMTLQFNKSYRQPADKVYAYAQQILSLGYIYLEYSDAIREGDGDRVLCCFRYLLPMFITAGRKNYAIEAFAMLAQHDLFLSPRLSA